MRFKNVPQSIEPVAGNETLTGPSRIKLMLKPCTDEELPTVSIVTITYNRQDFYNLMIRNFKAIDYPRDKLEWIVVDDSPVENQHFSRELKKAGARYIYVKKKIVLGRKRNFINCLARHEYIVHMDDDDYYPSISVASRIRTLLWARDAVDEVVGCYKVNCYDLITGNTFEAHDPTDPEDPLVCATVSESTLAYSKKYWLTNKFCDTDSFAESVKFIGSSTFCNMPSSFVITQLTHNNNTVTRRPQSSGLPTGHCFLNEISASDANILNDIKIKLVLKMPEYEKPLNFIRTVLSDLPNIKDHFDSCTDISVLKCPLVLNVRHEYLCTDPTGPVGPKRTVVYYCGPGSILNHSSKWSPYSKTIGGSEEFVISLSENLVKRGYHVTVYNVLDPLAGPMGPKGLTCNGVVYKDYYYWNPKDRQDITIIWRDYTILNGITINSKKIFLDMHDAIDVPMKINCSVVVKSEYHKTFVSGANDVSIIPNGIYPDLFAGPSGDTRAHKENFALCTSSPDRCLRGLLTILPIIRATKPDFKIYWAYGFSAGINEGGIATDTRPEVKKWYTDILELIGSVEGFVNLGRVSQTDIIDYYVRAKYFIYGTRFQEIDCISMTKACSAGCKLLVYGPGALKEKMDLMGPSGDARPGTGPMGPSEGIDTSLYSGPDFDKWLENTMKTLDSDSEVFDTKKINEIFNWDAVTDKWINLFEN
jgi:glycosyltransferase involved in cell wall biosynthesis